MGRGNSGSVRVLKNIKHVGFLNRPQQIQTDSSRQSGTLHFQETDPPKPLIGTLSRVVEQGYKEVNTMRAIEQG